MFAIGYDELDKKPKLPKVIICNKCKKKHNIKRSSDSISPEFSRLQYYKCKGKLYLAGLGWKDIRE